MPHLIVKLYPGKTAEQKSALAERLTLAVMEVLNCKETSVSVGFEEISAEDWKNHVFLPDIQSQPEKIYKKPGYSLSDLA